MFGIRLIIILAIVGGLIAYLGDWIGTKIGKGRMSLFGLRPRYTSILVAVFTGVSIAVFTIAIMAASSEEARTALFGVKALQQQMTDLKKEADSQQKEIDEARKTLDESQENLANAQKELVTVEGELGSSRMLVWRMQSEVGGLQDERNRLLEERTRLEEERTVMEGQVSALERVAGNLEKNISALREGNMLVRADQVLKVGVFAGGLSEAETRVNLNAFMEATNRELSEEYGGMLGGNQGLLMSEETFEDAVKFLSQHKEIYAIRVLSAGNLFAGEPLLVAFDIFPNVKVYEVGEIIHIETITVAGSPEELEEQVIAFLRHINEKAIIRGVKPDPIRGTVGAINLSDIYGTVTQLRKYRGEVELTAKAKQGIYSPGPVRVDIEMKAIRR